MNFQMGLVGRFGRLWTAFSVLTVVGLACLAGMASGARAATPYVQGASAVTLPSGYTRGSLGSQSVSSGGVTCQSGTCLVGGYAQSASGVDAAVLQPIVSGVVGAEAPITLPSSADNHNVPNVNDLSCWSAGTCIAAGYYEDAQTDMQALLVPVSGGQPGAPLSPTLPNDLNTTYPESTLSAVKCWSAGDCIAVGQYYTQTSDDEALVMPVANGTAGTGVRVTLPSGSAPTGQQNADLLAVDCWSGSSCVAVGNYYDQSSNQLPLVVPITDGVPGPGVSFALPTALSSGAQQAMLTSVRCTAADTCVAVGYYADASGYAALVVPITNGVPGTAVKVAIPAGGSNGYLNNVSCAASGTCYAVGAYTDASGNGQAMVVPITGQNVGSAIEVPAPANPVSATQQAALADVSCTGTLGCVAAGSYEDAAGHEQGMTVALEPGGAYTSLAAPVPADASTSTPAAFLSAIGCDASGACTAVGQYQSQSGWEPDVVEVQPTLAASTPAAGPGTVGSAFQQTLSATGAWGDYTWSVISGSLPSGLTLNPTTGEISGTPTTVGSFPFTVQVTGTGVPVQTATQTLSMTIAAASPSPNPSASAPLPPRVVLVGGLLKLVTDHVSVKLSCAQSPCAGRLKLTAEETVTVRRGRRRVRRHRTVVVASGRFRVGAGKDASVRVALTSAGRRLISRARHHRLRVRMAASVNGGNTASHAATVWAGSPAKHHRR